MIKRALARRLHHWIERHNIQPLRDEFEARLGAEIQSLGGTIEDLSGKVAGLSEHLPFLLERLSAANGFTRETQRKLSASEDRLAALEPRVEGLSQSLSEALSRVEARGEFIRKEIMHELRAESLGGGSLQSRVEPRVVNAEKLSQRPIRLNLGSGHIPVEGYINCDARDLPGVDVVCDARALPFDDGAIAEIRATHLLEHFPHEILRRVVLPHWFSALMPGGRLSLVIPDAEAMAKAHSVGDMSFEDLRLVTFGEQEYDGDFHYTMFSKESLSDLLTEVGFRRIEVIASGRKNGACLEMEVLAERPGPNVRGSESS